MLLANLPLTAPEGSTSYADATGRSWSGYSVAPIINDGAARFTGDGLIYTNSGSDFLLGTKDFDIAFDIQTTSTTLSTVLDYLTGSGSTWQVYFSTDGRLIWTAEGPNESPVIGTTSAVNDGNWHTVLFSRRDGVLSVSVDGTVQASVSHPRNYNYTISTFAIGGRLYLGFSNIFRGGIRNVYINVIDPPPAPARLAAFIRRNRIGWDKVTEVDSVKKIEVYRAPPATVRKVQVVRSTRGVPPWWGAPGSTNVLPTYKLRGRVMQRDPDTQEDTPLQNVRVALFYRRLHTLIDIQLSDANGYVQFNNLMPGVQAYYGIAFDSDGGIMQNSVLWDRLSSEPGP